MMPIAALRLRAAAGGNPPRPRWRLFITANDGSALYMGCTELRLKNAAGTVVSGYGFGGSGPSAYSASSEINGSNSPFYAFDGDLTSTGWLSATAGSPQWVAFNLLGTGAWGAAVDVRSFDIVGSWNAPSASPKDFELQWSDDGTTWNTAGVYTGETGWGAGELRSFVLP
jgi:hypothetical protein